jgi:hypothetical protein
MWMRSVAAESYPVVDVDEAFYTLIPSRFPTIDVFARIANNRSAEVAAVESLTNPRVKERDRLLGVEVVDGNAPLLQNWNHAPFTYTNPEGSRFFGPERPALEMARDMQTALAISIGKRERFLSRTNEAPIGLEMRELSRVVRGRFVDATAWDPALDLDERRRRGGEIAEAGYDGLLFMPIERPSGICVSVLRGEALEKAVQGDHFKYVWDGRRVRCVYSFGSGREFLPDELGGQATVLAA